MELSVNYSEEVKELLEEGKIDFVDYLKLYSINGDLSPFDYCVSKGKVLFHGLTGNGSNIARTDFLENRDWDLQRKYFEESRIPFVSFHISLGYNNINFEEEGETIETIKRNVEGIRNLFDYDILLENMPLRKKENQFFFLARPEFISKVIKETDTYFLLDIAHARATAYALDIPYIEYIKALPLERIREVHLSGCNKMENGEIIPNHDKMNEEDFEILEFLIKECKNLSVLTLEYGPYDMYTGKSYMRYGSVEQDRKQDVYENLLRLKEILNR